MNNNLRKALQVIAIAAIAAAIFLMRDETPVPPPEVVPEEAPENAEPTPKVHLDPIPDPAGEPEKTESLVTPEKGQMVVRAGIPASDEDAALLPPLVLEKGEQPWEGVIRRILETPNISESEKGRRLLEVMPTLAVQGRETATEEGIRRLGNEDYRYAQNIVTNAGTYPLALAVLWQDLMERPKDISLPTLLTVARNPAHPYAEAAVDNLDYLLGKNYGTDWARWDAEVRASLAAKPAAPGQ